MTECINDIDCCHGMCNKDSGVCVDNGCAYFGESKYKLFIVEYLTDLGFKFLEIVYYLDCNVASDCCSSLGGCSASRICGKICL